MLGGVERFGTGEPARVRIEPDGIAHLYIGSTPQGQGYDTSAAQVLADLLDWPLDVKRYVIVHDTGKVINPTLVRGQMHGGLAHGFKGAGESGAITAPATIVNAIEDAVRRVRPEAAITDIPATPLRLHAIVNRS